MSKKTRLIFILVKRKFIILLFLIANLSLSNFAFSTHVKNGFEALAIKNYFKAKKLFTKSIKYNPSPSGYGLATIYARNDNPFFNLDSAYRYVLLSDSTWQLTKERKKEKWAHYGWTKSGIDSLKQIISSQFYAIAVETRTVEEYTRFLMMHPWAKEFSKALYTRDSIAFHQAVAVNTSSAYKEYMDVYPNSEFFEIAKQNYFHAQFIELTGDGSLESYKEFVAKFPHSPLRYEADSMIFLFVTESNTIDAYKDFVENYSQNSLIEKGWREFYQVYLFEYSKERMREFLQLYPNATNKIEIEEDILWYDSILLPFKIEDNYGLMNRNGHVILPPQFSFISKSYNGLFLYGENQKLGVMNRKGEIISKADYDFISDVSNGRFVVEKGDFLGLIDRKGKILLPCELEDIGSLSNDLVYVSKNGLYYYTDYNGHKKIDSFFIEASDFRNEFAIVAQEDGQGVISKIGDYVIPAFFDRLKWLNDSILAYEENNKWGMLSIDNDTILKANFDYIGEFKEGLALASFNDTLVYLNIEGENQLNKFFSTFPNYRVKGEFVNSCAIVNREGRYGRINKNGDIITEIEFENLSLGTKFIPFEENGAWGILSLSNKLIIKSSFERVDIVDNRFAIVGQNDSVGVIDTDGHIVIPIKYQTINHVSQNCFSVYDGKKYGLYIGNNLVTGLEFSAIELFDKEFVSLTNDSVVVYYDLRRNRIVKHQLKIE